MAFVWGLFSHFMGDDNKNFDRSHASVWSRLGHDFLQTGKAFDPLSWFSWVTGNIWWFVILGGAVLFLIVILFIVLR